LSIVELKPIFSVILMVDEKYFHQGGKISPEITLYRYEG
jgi:hypothetical protein